MNAPSRRSADNEVTGRITPDAPASPAPPQGEREAFDGLSAKLWCDLRTDEERSAWLLLGRGHETGVVAQALQNDLAMAYHRLALLSASLRASPAVPVAQDERAEALQALVEALESFPGFAVDIGDERDTFVRKGKVALSLGRAALSAATPPAAVPMSQKTQDGHSTSGDLLGSYDADGRAGLRAWDDLPDALKAHPGVKAIYRGLLDVQGVLFSERIGAAMGTQPAADKEQS